MRLETAHKILIGAAILFFMIFSVFEVSRWRAGEGPASLGLAAGGLLAAGAFAVYLRYFIRGDGR